MSGSDATEARGLRMALVVYLLVVFAGKSAVYFLTGVTVLVAEALHTLGDIIISGFLLSALVCSRRRSAAPGDGWLPTNVPPGMGRSVLLPPRSILESLERWMR